MKKETGGSAFPHDRYTIADKEGTITGYINHETGLTLRDYFAGIALAQSSQDYAPPRAAERAYEYADAMLKERSK